MREYEEHVIDTLTSHQATQEATAEEGQVQTEDKREAYLENTGLREQEQRRSTVP